MPRQGQQGTGEAPALHPYRKLSRKQEVFPMSNLIPTSQVARSDARTAKPEPIFFDDTRHHFKAIAGFDVDKAVEGFLSPLSVILQVTRRCNFNCSFCSEIVQLPDPTLEELDLMRQHLQGVQRIFLSGGEPLLRKDFVEIAEMFSRDFIVGLPTNATAGKALAQRLVGKVAFVNIGLEVSKSNQATFRALEPMTDRIFSGR